MSNRFMAPILSILLLSGIAGAFLIPSSSDTAPTAYMIKARSPAPVVRVLTGGGSGSGTIIYSVKGRTFVLTNYHVIASVVEPPLYGPNPSDEADYIEVDLFTLTDLQHDPERRRVRATPFSYDSVQDIAIIELQERVWAVPVKLLPESEPLSLYDPVVVAGSALGETPFLTEGKITELACLIDGLPFVRTTADTIFGNSGGGAFTIRDGTWYFIGIPSRVRMYSPYAAATYIGYFIPLSRIRDFYRSRMLHEIFGE